MKYSSEDAIRKVVNCARAYDAELNNKKLLFICMDKHSRISYLEVSFRAFNFLHLTGLRLKNDRAQGNASVLNAATFYERCLARKLSPEDFTFSDYKTTPMKLDVLPAILNKNLSASMVGDFNSSKPKLYTEKLVGGAKACIGFVLNKTLGEYIPNTVIKEDIRNNVFGYLRIIATYRKNFTDNKYTELVYAAKNINWAEIKFSDEYAYLQKPPQNQRP